MGRDQILQNLQNLPLRLNIYVEHEPGVKEIIRTYEVQDKKRLIDSIRSSKLPHVIDELNGIPCVLIRDVDLVHWNKKNKFV